MARVAAQAGTQIREARVGRRWSLATVAQRAGVSIGTIHAAESGRPVSLEALIRTATALGLRPSLVFESGRSATGARTAGATRDVVHAAMGEFEAARFAGLGLSMAVDEPYQHFQFAGRADFLAWQVDERRLLHIENKSRIDDLQDLAGVYNAKRAYLGPVLADRLGLVPRGWRTVTHVVATLWSSEVLHVLRRRTSTVRAVCPDPTDAFDDWWSGRRPTDGVTSTIVIVDPDAEASPRRRPWIGLQDLDAARPRYRGYADAAARFSRR